MAHPTFKQMMNEVVAFGSCCECGSCVVVCPHNVIDYVDGKPKQTAKATAPFDFCGISEGIGCDVCAQVCPRLGEREHHLAPRIFDGNAVYAGGFGYYRRILASRSRDSELVARCQDGGVVTALLAWARSVGRIDGAVVAVADPGRPAAPEPRVVTTVDEILRSGTSWYTYCPNDLALEEVERRGLHRVAFVGVPCQVTPIRKMELRDPAFLDNGKKKEKHIERQRKFLKGFAERVALDIGLLCSEVFLFEGLMHGVIQGRLGIPLAQMAKFNVKGRVLLYLKDGTVREFPLREAQEHARPECHHCADFSAELADISCGGVATEGWTITILRSVRGEEVFDAAMRDGILEARPIEEFESSMRVLLRLARKQKERVPVPPGRSAGSVRPLGFAP